MKIRALTTKEIEYVLECQKDEPIEEQIKFKLKPLSPRQSAVLQDSLKIEYTKENLAKMREDAENLNDENALELVSKIKNFNEHLYNTLSAGLVGWSNFKDEDENEVMFGKNIEENIAHIPVEYRMELATEITKLASLKDSERKNS